MSKAIPTAGTLLNALLAACVLAAAPVLVQAHALKSDEGLEYRPTGKGSGEVDTSPGARVRNQASRLQSGSNGISYHNGPVMTAPANVYYIWYGNWSSYSTAQAVLQKLPSGLNSSPLYNINSTYYNGAKMAVSNAVVLAKETTDSYSQGTALSDAAVLAVVKKAILEARLPLDASGVYFVLTSPDVQETSGFGTQYCGWHTYGTASNGTSSATIKYSFVGNPLTIAPSGCGVKSPSPNGDGGADAMASVIYHELSEAVTDPQLNAWYDTRGYENADKCAWKFGTTYKTTTGATANVNLGGSDWLIQQNWVNAGGGRCSLSYP